MTVRSVPVEVKSLISRNVRARYIGGILLVSLIVLMVVGVNLGQASITPIDTLKIIAGKLTNNPSMYEEISQGIVSIVWYIRLPRIICGVFVGAGLAMAGAVFQALLMNTLADPYTLGISTGAALGATISIYVTSILEIASVAILPAAFIGALVTLFLVTKIAGKSKSLSSSNLIIAGIIVSSIASAAISFIKSVSGDEVSLIVFWLMGSLASRTWLHCLIIVPIILICGYVCYRYGNELNLICTGEENARAYGVEVEKTRKILLISASLMTAACVSVSGIIGFVGLVIPHILRFSITSDNKFLIPLSGLLGALMLMVADNITRAFLAVEIPVGVLTTLIGGPFFIYLFIGRRGKGGSTI